MVKVLRKQNKSLKLSTATINNIDALLSNNTYTITTGHQLCLFTGPLYVIYKIISAINLSRDLNKTYPHNIFVPLFWMASEDHDIEEVNHVNVFGKKLIWDSNKGGAVGRKKLHSIENILVDLERILSRIANKTFRLLTGFPLTDSTTGIKMFKKDFFQLKTKLFPIFLFRFKVYLSYT